VTAPIVNGYGVAHHLGKDGAGAAPGAKDLFLSALVHGFDFLEQVWGHVRPFFQRSSHY
jgi:hypothetical protein